MLTLMPAAYPQLASLAFASKLTALWVLLAGAALEAFSFTFNMGRCVTSKNTRVPCVAVCD